MRGLWSGLEEAEEDVGRLLPRLRRLPGIKLIVLYGSRARGNHEVASDVDLMIVYGSRGEEEKARDDLMHLMADVSPRIHVVQSNLEDLSSRDPTFLDNVFREGIILYASKEVKIPVEKVLNLKPYSIFTYTTQGKSASLRKRLERALYGSVEVKTVGGKRRTYTYEGLVSQHGLRLGRSCFLLPNEKAPDARKTLELLGVPYQELKIYAPPLNIPHKSATS